MMFLRLLPRSPSLLFLLALLYCPPALAQMVELSRLSRHDVRIGVEGFQDKYIEDSVRLVEHARFAAATAEYIHSSNGFFSSAYIRAGYGRDDYKSISGTIRDIPQYEGEFRVRTGLSIPIGNVGGVKALVPYIGLGTRYFYDNSKNQVTSLGFFGYDRRIIQLYAPIGAMWQFEKWGYTFSTTGEFDILLYGRVESRFRNFDPTAATLINKQKKGYGIRGEFMMGQRYEDFGWEIGPFVRYWDVDDSDPDTIPSGFNAGTYIEPENTRTQVGAALRVTF